jgi:hypothetical protein
MNAVDRKKRERKFHPDCAGGLSLEFSGMGGENEPCTSVSEKANLPLGTGASVSKPTLDSAMSSPGCLP